MSIENIDERNDFINAVKRGSVMTWSHVNLRGNYDFRRKSANDEVFNLEEIKLLKIS